MYDVWHKPTIKPAVLTQAETKALYETKVYCGESFCPEYHDYDQMMARPTATASISGEDTAVEVGKKGFAIRETVSMFGARLLQDIYERPSHYFARREIVRTEAELVSFRRELFSIYLAQQAFSRSGFWFSNEAQCKATFTCPYYQICYGHGADAACDGKTVPPGYKRIFGVDLTIKGRPIGEEE